MSDTAGASSTIEPLRAVSDTSGCALGRVSGGVRHRVGVGQLRSGAGGGRHQAATRRRRRTPPGTAPSARDLRRREADEEHRRRRARRVRELHLHLVQQPVALAQVARRAGGDDVLPDRLAAARARDHVVERQPAARGAAVDAAPAVTGEERPARDLPLDDPRDADVAERAGSRAATETSPWPSRVVGRALRPPPPSPCSTSTCARRSEHTLSGSKLAFRTRTCCTVPEKYRDRAASGQFRVRSRAPPELTAPSRARPPAAPRARARPTACRGRSPSCRSGRSRGPGSR